VQKLNIHKSLILWKTFSIFVLFFDIIDNTRVTS